MGATYEALDKEGERVVVKVVGVLSDVQRKRFEGECRMLHALDHPGIVRYRDHGILENGNGFLVMDYVESLDLQKVLEMIEGKGGQNSIVANLLTGIPLEGREIHSSGEYQHKILGILARVADALHHAHGKRVVHRDVKPSNILLDRRLEPLLIDFGLGQDLFQDVSLTRSGAVMGTISYMAPEQIQGGREVDGRADIHALGLVLYRALTGIDLRRDISDLIRLQTRPLLLKGSKIAHHAQEIRAILYRCLEPRPDRRYPSASALASDLRGALGEGRVEARVPGPGSRFLRSGWCQPVLLAALFLALAVIAFLRGPGGHPRLFVDALHDGGRLVLDGRQELTPLVEWHPVERGWHVIAYDSEEIHGIQRRFQVTETYTRLNLLTVRTDREISLDLTQGEEGAFLVLHPGEPGNQAFLDDRKIPAFYEWVGVPPGRHRIRVKGPSGVEEEQVLFLPVHERSGVHILSRHLKEIEGSYRFTLGHVISPLPEGVRFELEEGAVPFMNDEFDLDRHSRYKDRAVHNFITSMHAGKEVKARIHVEFGRVMRSAVFHFSCSYVPPRGSLTVEYRVEGRSWQKLDFHQKGTTAVYQAEIPPQGTGWFELQGRIRINQTRGDWSEVQFLGSYMGEDGERPKSHPCFGIVADRDPSRAKLPRKKK